MLNRVYYVIKYGSLDDLYVGRDKCLYVIKRCEDSNVPKFIQNYLKTALAHLPLWEKEIQVQRDAGKETIAESIAKCTGNNFTILRSLSCG